MTPHDDERLSALYRAGTQEEPPAHLDQQIRDAARRQAPRRHRGWMPALATAAVLVLAVAVMIRVPDERVEDSDRGIPKRAEEAIPVQPGTGSSAGTPVGEEAVAPRTIKKMEQPPAPRFEYYWIRPETEPAGPVVIPPEDLRPAKSAPEAAVAADEARESADSAGHETIDARRLKTDRDRCRPPDAMLTEDRETLLERIEELERQGRQEEAECLRLWLEDSTPR